MLNEKYNKLFELTPFSREQEVSDIDKVTLSIDRSASDFVTEFAEKFIRAVILGVGLNSAFSPLIKASDIPSTVGLNIDEVKTYYSFIDNKMYVAAFSTKKAVAVKLKSLLENLMEKAVTSLEPGQDVLGRDYFFHTGTHRINHKLMQGSKDSQGNWDLKGSGAGVISFVKRVATVFPASIGVYTSTVAYMIDGAIDGGSSTRGMGFRIDPNGKCTVKFI